MSPEKMLIRFIERRKPILWLGAGASMGAGLPSADGLAARLWEEHAIYDKPKGLHDAYALIDAFVDQHSQGELHQALTHLIPANVQPTELHEALARLEIPPAPFFKGGEEHAFSSKAPPISLHHIPRHLG